MFTVVATPTGSGAVTYRFASNGNTFLFADATINNGVVNLAPGRELDHDGAFNPLTFIIE